MQIQEEIKYARLIKRYKRFLADVQLESGEIQTIHCPNSGTMKSCAEPGYEVCMSISTNPKRKLKATFEYAHNGQSWIGVNTHRANDLVSEGILGDKVFELSGYETLRREVKYGENSRIDILLSDPSKGLCYVEVKNVTLLLENGVVAFPDAKTSRGLKHLKELSQMVASGHRAVMFYLVNREDGRSFRPATEIDPEYAQGLKEAVECGVEVLVYSVQISPPFSELSHKIPFTIHGDS